MRTEKTYEVLTEQDLVFVWQHMLQTTKATYAEMDLERLNYSLVDVTLTHYIRQNLKHPLKQVLQDFNLSKWQWYRLRERVKTRQAAQKKHY